MTSDMCTHHVRGCYSTLGLLIDGVLLYGVILVLYGVILVLYGVILVLYGVILVLYGVILVLYGVILVLYGVILVLYGVILVLYGVILVLYGVILVLLRHTCNFIEEFDEHQSHSEQNFKTFNQVAVNNPDLNTEKKRCNIQYIE